MNPQDDGKIDVHNYDRQIEIQKRLLEEASIREDNRHLIKDFLNFCEVDPKVGESRIRLYYYALRRIAELTDKNFKEMSESDLIAVLAKLKEYKTAKGKNYSPQSIMDFTKAISKFWRWLYFDEHQGEAPPQIRRIKCGAVNDKKEPEVYTKEEIKAIIDVMTTIRDKAFFSCLYDLQPRVSELLSRQMKHVRHTPEGDVQMLIEADKTSNSHWETLFESVPHFTTWMRLHPSHDPNAPLWTVMRKKGELLPLRYATVRKLFLNACERQKIREGRRNHLHMFRKSKVTHDLSDGIPLTYIESRGSWAKGSRALQTCYISVMQKDKDNAYKKKYGMQVNNNHQITTELKKCLRCQAMVEAGAKFCAMCGFPADKKVLAEMSEVDSKIANLVDKDKNLLSELVKKYVLEELAEKKNKKNKL